MDKIDFYEQCILRILNDYAKIRYANVTGENQLIADKENRRYQVVTIGWEGDVFVHDCPMHMDIIHGKIWIQRNMTEVDLGHELMAMGVPASEIVLGFYAPELREYTDYAVA